MNVEIQKGEELTTLSKLIENMSVCMLVSLSNDGGLVSKPMSPLEMDKNGAIWFFTDLSSDNIGLQSLCNLSFTDESRGTYVSISGTQETVLDHAHIERLWFSLARPWFPDGPNTTNIALLKFVPQTADFWDGPRSKMVRLFAMAVSVIAGKPIGLGDHETLTDLSRSSSNHASSTMSP